MKSKATVSDSSSVASFINSSLQECNKQMHESKYNGGFNDVFSISGFVNF